MRAKYRDVNHLSTETLAQWLATAEVCCTCDSPEQGNDNTQSTEEVENASDTPQGAAEKTPASGSGVDDNASKSSDYQHSCNPRSMTGVIHCRGMTVILFDTRDEREYNVSHLEGARRVSDNITEKEVAQLLGEYLGVSGDQVNIVCYCSLGYRSSDLVRKINRQLKNVVLSQSVSVYNLDGSIFKWANEDRKVVENDGEKTIFVHPYNHLFGLTLRKELRKY